MINLTQDDVKAYILDARKRASGHPNEAVRKRAEVEEVIAKLALDTFWECDRIDYLGIKDIPSRELAQRVVGSLILCKGNLNRYAIVLEALIIALREE